MTQARPKTFHRVTVHTRAVGVTPSILARAMVDRPMVIIGLSEMVNIVCSGEALRPDFHLGSDTARTLVALIPFHWVLQLVSWIQMVRLVDTPIEQMDTPLRRPLLESAAAAMVACNCNCHRPITSNHSRGRNLLSSKIELVQ